MAMDYGKSGIRANTVCPSATATEMFLGGSTQEVIDSFYNQNPMGRIGKPEDVLAEGQEVEAKIIDVDADRKRISLSIRALTEKAPEEAAEADAVVATVE